MQQKNISLDRKRHLFLVIILFFLAAIASPSTAVQNVNQSTTTNLQSSEKSQNNTQDNAQKIQSQKITPTPTITAEPTTLATEQPAATTASSSTPTLTSTPTTAPTYKATAKPTPVITAAPTPVIKLATPIPTIAATPASGGTGCNCAKTCDEMTSCAEAQYQLNICKCTQRDRDNDGIACDGAPLHCQN